MHEPVTHQQPNLLGISTTFRVVIFIAINTINLYNQRVTVDNSKLKKILKETFGYSDFRFEQENIINSVLKGEDTLAIMPTGGGKSLCYQLPAFVF